MTKSRYYFQIRSRKKASGSNGEEEQTEFTYEEFLSSVEDKRVTVIGITGKSHYGDGKANFVDEFLQADAFKPKNDEMAVGDYVEGVHDTKKNLVFLHLKNYTDSLNLISLAKKEEIKEKGFHWYLAKGRENNVLMSLFLFHVCHIIVLHFPTLAVDASYFTLFKTMHYARSEFIKDLKEIMEDAGLSEKHKKDGRFLKPKIFFYFPTSPQVLQEYSSKEWVEDQVIFEREEAIRNLEAKLRHQISKVLKPSFFELYSFPSGFDYVYVDIGRNKVPFHDAFRSDFNFFLEMLDNDSAMVNASPERCTPYFEEIEIDESREERSFSKCLGEYISWLPSDPQLSEGLYFKLPLAKNWYPVAKAMFNLFCSPANNSEIIGSKCITSYVGVVESVSNSICVKALSRAYQKYQTGLPNCYLEDHHEKKLNEAISDYNIHGRGPCAPEHTYKLIETCTYEWENYRKQCEALSLTGKHCVNQTHGENVSHFSNYVMLSACNCGKTLDHRADPYDLKEANYDFYIDLEDECCQELEHFDFPHQSSLDPSSSPREDDELSLLSEGVQTVSLEEISSSPTTVDIKNHSDFNVLTLEEEEQNVSPDLPYWSLLRMGPSSVYNHSSGVNQSGFVGSYKQLLSWDIPLVKTELSVLREKWPNLVETAVKKMTLNPQGKGVEMGIMVKVFLGCEYECHKGHRFIANSPDFRGSFKSNKGSASHNNSARVIDSDMPIYINCVCSDKRSTLIAQLMRIHVVTPKAPIFINLFPRIVPLEGGPTFVSGHKEPISLPPNTYWVMRLPFIYASKSDGDHLPPGKLNDLNRGKLLRGFISSSENSEFD